MQDIIQLKDVEFRWSQHKPPTLLIDELNIAQGQHTFIKGPSGCGKSTLLGLLTGINQAQQGEVSILGNNLNKLKSSQRDRFRADHIGYIFQQFNLLPYLSVIDNVLLPCQFSRHRKANTPAPIQNKAKELLSSLKLPEALFHQPVIELSIGQQQRVAAARALIGSPELLIADEPTSALDHDNRTHFIELLMAEAQKTQSTLVFVSHDPTLEPLFKRSINLMDINKAGRES